MCRENNLNVDGLQFVMYMKKSIGSPFGWALCGFGERHICLVGENSYGILILNRIKEVLAIQTSSVRL